MKQVLAIGLLLGTLFGVLFTTQTLAHPGRTDSDDGHYCWTNCSYWDEVYGEWHSHGGYYSPPAAVAWKCTIGDQTFYSKQKASDYWYGKVHEYVNVAYRKLLNREATTADYPEFDQLFSFNDCRSLTLTSPLIETKVKLSEEYQSNQTRKVAGQAARTTAQEAVVDQDDYSWLWAPIGIGGFIGSLWVIERMFRPKE